MGVLSEATGEFFRRDDSLAESKVVESENVVVVTRLYDALEKSDIAAFGRILAPQVTFEIVGPSFVPFTGLTRGREEVIKTVSENFGLLEKQQPKIDEVVAQGQVVVVFGFETGKFKDSSTEYELNWVHRFKIENGLVASIRQIFDSASLLNAGP